MTDFFYGDNHMRKKRLYTVALYSMLTICSTWIGCENISGITTVYAEELLVEGDTQAEVQKEDVQPEIPESTEAVSEVVKQEETQQVETSETVEIPVETQPPIETTEPPVPTEAIPETQVQTQEKVPEETIPDTSDTESSVIEVETPGETSTETELIIEEESTSEIVIEEITVVTEKETEEETEKKITNEELISRQNIVTPPALSMEFRFTQVEKVYALVKNPMGTAVYEEKSDSSEIVGTMKYYGLCYVLEDDNSDWVYVESGDVRGFVPADQLKVGEETDRIVERRGENNLSFAESMMDYQENSAYTYTHTTTKKVVAIKVYALAKSDIDIMEGAKVSARIVGTLKEGGLCYILADRDKYWVYVESGDARGFVRASQLLTGAEAVSEVREKGETFFEMADTVIKPEANKACYYTLTSVQEASANSILRSDMVNFSFQFLGNPYVWGGTSLTNGCDCSGFTQSIYANFGYSIPRVAEAQAVYGMQIPVSSAAPGDLIFYAKDGMVYHVSMYIGDGQVIHAYGQDTGIIISEIGGHAVWATRIIS